MTRELRRAHRWIWIALALILPLFFGGAILMRGL